MIAYILLFYVGVQIDAPGWYYALSAVACLLKAINAGREMEK